MSVEVIITAPETIRLDFKKILGRNYFAAVRDPYDKAWPEEIAPGPSNELVIFNFRRLGRGVELNFLNWHKINLIMHTPGATVDLETFKLLLEKLVKAIEPSEVICDDEIFAVEKIDEIEKRAEENLKLGMDFLLSDVVKQAPVEIISYKGPISIDEEEQKQFLGGQAEFDKYLDKKTSMPGVNELIVPIIAETDMGFIWAVTGLKAGRYMILPKYARPRNKDMKVDYFVVFNNHGKAISYNDFLREVDASRRFDAERFIVKFTKTELQNIFDKYPDILQTIIPKNKRHRNNNGDFQL